MLVKVEIPFQNSCTIFLQCFGRTCLLTEFYRKFHLRRHFSFLFLFFFLSSLFMQQSDSISYTTSLETKFSSVLFLHFVIPKGFFLSLLSCFKTCFLQIFHRTISPSVLSNDFSPYKNNIFVNFINATVILYQRINFVLLTGFNIY